MWINFGTSFCPVGPYNTGLPNLEYRLCQVYFSDKTSMFLWWKFVSTFLCCSKFGKMSALAEKRQNQNADLNSNYPTVHYNTNGCGNVEHVQKTTTLTINEKQLNIFFMSLFFTLNMFSCIPVFRHICMKIMILI